MNSAVLNEDYLEFDEWPFPDYTESSGPDDNFENQLIMKFKCEDYFYRKQAFQKAMMYIQSQQYSDCNNRISSAALFNALILICNDSEVALRTDLAESLVTITKLCSTRKAINGDYDVVKCFTLPCVIAFFHDANKQVRLSSHNTVMNLIESKIITKEMFYEEIWLPLEELLVSYNPDELRIESFTLLVQISQLLDNCLEKNLLEFSREFIASNDNLRKTCASYLCTIIDKSSNNFIMEWLEIFYKLSEDTSWYVKKFCIECAISFSKKLTHEERWNNITDVYYNLLTDNKKWVTSSAFQNLGAFIATFADSSKSHLELSPDGHIINLLSSSRSSSRQSYNPDHSEDSDANKYNSFQFWNQPVANNVAQPASISSVSLSIKDIDLNAPDSAIRSDYGVPDLSNYHQAIILSQLGYVTGYWEIIPVKLLRCYVNTVHEFIDIDLIRPCAYSLPAIMFTLGPSCWPFLRSVYMKLVQSISWKVRISLAASIQHTLQIFQQNPGAVNDIIWAYKEFIKDVDEVKTGLVSHIAEFYLAVPVERYSEIFEDFKEAIHLDSARNWRYRVTCMEQLQCVVVGIDLSGGRQRIRQFLQIFKAHWLPVVFTFVADEVCAVRAAALELMLRTLARLTKWKSDAETPTEEIDNIISDIKKKILLFSDSHNWYLRQLFLQGCVQIVQQSILSQEVIDECFIPRYLHMCIHDAVPNNRMVGGRGLVSICNQDYLEKIPESIRRQMESVCNSLIIDTDRDVRQSVIKLKDLFESL